MLLEIFGVLGVEFGGRVGNRVLAIERHGPPGHDVGRSDMVRTQSFDGIANETFNAHVKLL